MKRLLNIHHLHILLFACCLAFTTIAQAQQEYQEEDPGSEIETEKNKANYNLGNGLNFSFNEGNYTFGLTGFIQPSFFRQGDVTLFVEGLPIETIENDGEEFTRLNSKRSFLQFEGAALKEKVSFFIQLDYSRSNPLMDAWFAYQPVEQVKISFGQKQTFVNNREMMIREDRLQFTDRSLLSQTFSETGREFGVFVESSFKIGNTFGIQPMAAVTSGDGRNSFGEDSRDSDIGGLKVGGRLDIYPLGFFKEGNDLTNVDLGREDSPKFVLGLAGSQNTGASGPTGEGHEDFLLFDENGNESLPDYNQLYVDVLFKYKGFSFLAEYANASATGIDKVFIDEAATQILAPQQISGLLALGDSYNFQLGYVFKNGFSVDVRRESIRPEFDTFSGSILGELDATTIGVTKYFINNSLKIQSSYTRIELPNGDGVNQAEILLQISL